MHGRRGRGQPHSRLRGQPHSPEQRNARGLMNSEMVEGTSETLDTNVEHRNQMY